MMDKMSTKFQLNPYLAHKKCSVNTASRLSFKQNSNNEHCSDIGYICYHPGNLSFFTFIVHLCVLSIRAEDHPIFSGRWTG